MNKHFDMADFLHQLKRKYQQILQDSPLDDKARAQMQKRLNSLRLADAQARKLEAGKRSPDHAFQVGILGPTQAGKSTLLNAITGTSVAGISPLAGYTVHAQGFGLLNDQQSSDMQIVLEGLFEDFELTPTGQLDADNYQQYSLTSAAPQKPPDSDAQIPARAPMVVWDSPDFDSIESRGYRSAVLRVAALSDVLVIALSKDKYADRAVWDMVDLLAPLGKPMLMVVNKLNPEDEATVLQALQQRLQQVFADALPPVITIPYIRAMDNQADNLPDSVISELHDQLQQTNVSAIRLQQESGLQRLIDRHWADWIEPVALEHQAMQEWQQAVTDSGQQALKNYRDNYLDHPQNYDTFNRAIAELLSLLEIPGLAGPLTATRKIVTWPMRKLFDLSGAAAAVGKGSNSAPTDRERDALLQGCELMQSTLLNHALDQTDTRQREWWQAVQRQLRTSQPAIQQHFGQQLEQYQIAFQPEIDDAAKSLYRSLQEQPAVLNSLRAARVTTDAAAVVLAVKSGGLAASDLIIAPAMLSVTSMLTEGAVGRYMDSVKQKLQQSQYEQVSSLINTGLESALKDLPEQMDQQTFFSIDQQLLSDATIARSSGA